MVPSIDGYPIFGNAVLVQTVQRPRQTQINYDFGGQGQLGIQDGGGRGTEHRLSGTITGIGPAGLASSFGAIRSYNDGQTHTFVDALGTAWPNTVVGPVQPMGRIWQSPGGVYGRRFTCTLTTLSAQA
jgi:hypothetical protein